MIRLIRPAEPAFLVRGRAKWTNRWTKCLEDGKTIKWATKAALTALRDPLVAFSNGKCASCEGMLNVTSFVEVEHYHAKTIRRELAFHWPNLFPSCGICNRVKGELDHNGSLLKPDEEDPELLLWLHPDTCALQPHPSLTPEQTERVDTTIAAYRLNRGGLCEMRFEKMREVNHWLSRVAEGLGETPQCLEEWRNFVRPTTPWKFVIRHVLTLRGQAQLAAIDRQTFLQQP